MSLFWLVVFTGSWCDLTEHFLSYLNQLPILLVKLLSPAFDELEVIACLRHDALQLLRTLMILTRRLWGTRVLTADRERDAAL